MSSGVLGRSTYEWDLGRVGRRIWGLKLKKYDLLIPYIMFAFFHLILTTTLLFIF